MKPFPIGGHILAGGRSSRMGTDKALLQLADKPLIAHAVSKAHGLCADVTILGTLPALSAYGPLLSDIHPGCGPIGGIETALKRSSHAWNLFLAVDMPFLPSAFLRSWLSRWSQQQADPARIRIFTAAARPQPGFCLLHRDVLPYISAAIVHRDYKLMRAFDSAAAALAQSRGIALESILYSRAVEADIYPLSSDTITPAQLAARPLWFANLNTPEEFAAAEAHLDALDR